MDKYLHQQTQKKQVAKKSFPFLMSDESINDYGFRLLTSGCDLSAFSKNPVALWSHDNREPAIGKWEGVKIEGKELKGSFVPVEGDAEVERIVLRIEQDVIKACSVGLEIIETSTDPTLMLAGQTLPTVTKWVLLECSPTNIGSNKNALRLYHKGKLLELNNAEFKNTFLSINQEQNFKPNNNMNKILLAAITIYGLAADSTEEAVIEKLKALKAESDRNKSDLSTAQEKIVALQSANVKVVLDAAETAGKFTKEQRPNYEKLAAVDFETLKATLDMMTGTAVATTTTTAPAKTLASQIAAVGNSSSAAGTSEGSEADEYRKLDKEGKLAKLKSSDPAKFERLSEAFKLSVSEKGIVKA
jgi:hypothetical protein